MNRVVRDEEGTDDEMNIRGNAHAAIHLRTINQFLKPVYLSK
jgi:hypothetical protein